MGFIERFARIFSRQIDVVLQSEMLECAHACIVMVARYHGAKWTLDRLRDRFVPSSRGVSVSQIAHMSNEIGLHARILRAEPHHLPDLTLPCVLHWDGAHYVVLERANPASFSIVDPASGRMEVGREEFDKRFTGIVVEFSPGARLTHPLTTRGTGALALVRSGMLQHAAGLTAVVALAILIEGLSLVSPLLVQMATDKAIPASDASLLVLLCAAFAAASVVQAGVSLARTSLLLRIGARLIVAWNTEVCSRILRLPYIFFLRRSVGDLTSRFRSIDVIQRTITARFLQAILDGATSLLILVIILRYSAILVAITAGFTVAYAALRLLTLPKLMKVTETSIRLQASQQTLLLDALRGIQSIKANGFEANQLGRYHAKTKATANSTLRLEGWTAGVEEAGQLIVRLHWIAAVGAASALVMRGMLTPGMLIAYITYAHQFTTRSARFLDRLTDWKLLLLHAERVSELIAGSDVTTAPTQAAPVRDCSLSIRELTFSYNASEIPVLDRLSLDIGDGECVAITGPSGSGKSTLAKIIMGLLQPTSGSVDIGGQPVAGMDASGLRGRIACVMQDDQLFNGTVAGNIAFFEPGYSREAVIEAAKLANIHDEIMAMPLQYESRVFDLGASLSGGQRQRLLLARALYRRPSILVLDEASSHLDLDNESHVNEAISKLCITRIVIAHRPATLDMADRVYRMDRGRLVPVPRREPAHATAVALG
jgi:ATP-binding cassette subfamily B protein RaxB